MAILNVDFFKVSAQFESVMKKKMLLKTIFYEKMFGGVGMEFDSFRKYSEDDDANLIDWKTTARTKKPVVRQYVKERSIKVFILIDSGDDMVFSSGNNNLKAERSAEIASCVADLVISAGDSVGYAMYSDKINFMEGFGGGRSHFFNLINGLNKRNNYGNHSSLKDALEFIKPHLKDANAVFIISDFINLDKETLDALKRFSRIYETIGVMVRDPVDENLPDIKNEVAIEDPESGEQIIIQPSLVRNLFQNISKEEKNKIKEEFERYRVSLFENHTNENFIIPFARFLRTRVQGRSRG